MYALVDANSFYCSVERSFNPALEGRPVIVLSNRDGNVIARNAEAKALGIKMTGFFFEMKELVDQHKVVVFSSNYPLYGDISARLMSCLAKFVEDVEVYSIDEAFLLVDDSYNQYYPSYQGLGETIRAKIKQWLRLPVSIGFGPTKTLSKIANKLAKQNPALNGVCVLDTPQKINEALETFPVEDIWGVGHRSSGKLKKFDIRTAAQLRDVPDDWIRQKMTVNGVRLVYELRGKPCKLLEVNQPARKSICTEPGFGQVTPSYEQVQDALTFHLSRICEKLRKQDSLAGCLTVYLRTDPNRKTAGNGLPSKQFSNSRTVRLPHPTSSTAELLQYASAALKEIFAFGYHYLRVGIMLTDLVPADYRQPGLFVEGPNEKSLKLAKVVDKLNYRYGKDTLRIASQMRDPEWPMKPKYLSPCYTTRWQDILVVK